MGYKSPISPRDYQAKYVELHSKKKGFCLWWEPGTGKSKAILDQTLAIINDNEPNINTLVVIGPNKLVDNWINTEVPKHWPKELISKCNFYLANSSKFKSKREAELRKYLVNAPNFLVVTIPYDSCTAKEPSTWLNYLINNRRCFVVLDESVRIKTPSTVTSKFLVGNRNRKGLNASCAMRRVLTGTPITQNIFDLYSQVEFACPGFWQSKGLANYSAFKQHFGIFKKRFLNNGVSFDELIDFRNTEQLKQWLPEISSRMLKPNDLPPKIYMPDVNFTLSKKERECYDSLDRELFAYIDSNTTIEVNGVLALLAKLRQASSGILYSRDENGELITHKTTDNEFTSRQQALYDLLETFPEDHQTIIWFTYREEKEQIKRVCEKLKEKYVVYEGTPEECFRKETEYKEGKAKYFIANPMVAGEALTLINTKSMIYYSHDPRLRLRIQSEDRAHRLGLNHSVNYYNIMGLDTKDQRMVELLIKKAALAKDILDSGAFSESVMDDIQYLTGIENVGNKCGKSSGIDHAL